MAIIDSARGTLYTFAFSARSSAPAMPARMCKATTSLSRALGKVSFTSSVRWWFDLTRPFDPSLTVSPNVSNTSKRSRFTPTQRNSFRSATDDRPNFAAVLLGLSLIAINSMVSGRWSASKMTSSPFVSPAILCCARASDSCSAAVRGTGSFFGRGGVD